MFKPARNLSTGRRSFRLAPLEMMIIGIIVLGVLFLISMWVRTLFSSGSMEEAQPSANAAQLEQALGATETLRAQLTELQAELGRLGNRVQDGGQGSGQAAPQNWEKRLADMQEQINRLGHAESAAASAKLASRVAELEKGEPELAKQMAALEKAVKPIENRLAGLEKRPVQDPELVKRLDQLQKQLEAIPRTDLKPIEDKLAAMDKTLARLDKTPEVLAKSITTLEKRLERLEKEVSRRPAASDKPAGPTPEVLSRLEKLEQSSGPKLAEINQRLAGVEKSLDKVGRDLASARQAAGKTAAPDPGMAARLDKLEQTAETQSEETRKISRQLAGLNRELDQLGQGEEVKPEPAPVKPAPQVKPQPKPAPPQDTSDFSRYKVRRGDTLYAIARRHKVTVAQIKDWNPKLKRRRYLWVGETLLINPGARD